MFSPATSLHLPDSTCNHLEALSVDQSININGEVISNDAFSDFGDEDCGEPLLPQHLNIDFTPDADTDNDFVQKKVCAFWKFIHSQSEIKNLMIKPVNVKIPTSTNHEIQDSRSIVSNDETIIEMGKTAVSLLEFVEQKGLIDRTFEAKLPQTWCSMGSREYLEDELDTLKNEQLTKKGRISTPSEICKCTIPCVVCSGAKRSESPTSVKILCKNMNEWDRKHPKPIDSFIVPKDAPLLDPDDAFSEFGDSTCGEPMFTHQATLDFTPDPKIDTDFIQKKVTSFWEFIKNTPEIHNLKVEAEKPTLAKADSTESQKSATSMAKGVTVPQQEPPMQTAVDFLYVVEEKGQIDSIFEAKMPQSLCTLGDRECAISETPTNHPKGNRNPRTEHSGMSANRRSGLHAQPSKHWNRRLKEWDAIHPNPNATVYMFTVSCYAFHPLIQRFVRLWRYVQVVSDVLTFLVSMICCQCIDAMPLSSSASCETKPSLQIFDTNALRQRNGTVTIDAERSGGEPLKPQHMVIDFSPGREDTPEIQAKCQQFWKFANNKTELEGMNVQASPVMESQLIDLSNTVIHSDASSERNILPSIHVIKKVSKKGTAKVCLECGHDNQYYTST